MGEALPSGAAEAEGLAGGQLVVDVWDRDRPEAGDAPRANVTILRGGRHLSVGLGPEGAREVVETLRAWLAAQGR